MSIAYLSRAIRCASFSDDFSHIVWLTFTSIELRPTFVNHCTKLARFGVLLKFIGKGFLVCIRKAGKRFFHTFNCCCHGYSITKNPKFARVTRLGCSDCHRNSPD